jgi:hypothetical protein
MLQDSVIAIISRLVVRTTHGQPACDTHWLNPEERTIMHVKSIAIPFVAAAGMTIGLFVAPAAAAAAANDPCKAPVSSSRCHGPSGISGFEPPRPNAGAQNGPYGPWGNVPPIGR